MAEEDDYTLGMGGSIWGDQVSISTRTSTERPGAESEDTDGTSTPKAVQEAEQHNDEEATSDTHDSLHSHPQLAEPHPSVDDLVESRSPESELGKPLNSGIDILPFQSHTSGTITASNSHISSSNEASKASTAPVPRSSRVKKTFRPSRARKADFAGFEEAGDDPLDPLGAKGGSENGKDDDSESHVHTRNDSSGLAGDATGDAFQDIPLNSGSGNTAADSSLKESSKDHADELVASGFRNLDIGDGSAGAAAAVDSGKLHDEDDDITFKILVGDPHRVGDLTSAHTVYTVHTVTNSPTFEKKESSVTRRYKDFRWLFHALEHNNNGIIIPPPPDKQAVGRFNEDFVEQRRAALEVMLQKVAKHKVLRKDNDFRLFLESDTFNQDIKHRLVSSEELDQTQNSGLISTIGGAFSFSGKFIETSQWYIDKKIYIDNLESQLKFVAKALESVIGQRRELSEAIGEFALVLESLADIEVSKKLSELLQNFADAHSKVKDLYNRQCLQDILSLSTTLDEYIRLIASIRAVFSQRQKAFFAVQQAEHDLVKKRSHLEKLHRQGKSLQDKISLLQQEVEQQEQKVINTRVAFDDISKVIIHEFSRIEFERIADFRNSAELFLENAVESQKEAIEIWETFYQLGYPPAQQQ